MSTPHSEPKNPTPPIDAEIARGSILKMAAALAAITLFALGLIWVVIGRLESSARSAAPPPSPLEREIRASAAEGPPGPLLQPNPDAEMQQMRRQEDHLLSTYGWVDRNQGIVRLPIERAIDLVLASGLPQRPTTPAIAPDSGRP